MTGKLTVRDKNILADRVQKLSSDDTFRVMHPECCLTKLTDHMSQVLQFLDQNEARGVVEINLDVMPPDMVFRVFTLEAARPHHFASRQGHLHNLSMLSLIFSNKVILFQKPFPLQSLCSADKDGPDIECKPPPSHASLQGRMDTWNLLQIVHRFPSGVHEAPDLPQQLTENLVLVQLGIISVSMETYCHLLVHRKDHKVTARLAGWQIPDNSACGMENVSVLHFIQEPQDQVTCQIAATNSTATIVKGLVHKRDQGECCWAFV